MSIFRDIYYVCLDAAGKRLSTILSAILNYLRYKVGCDEEFGKINSKIVSQLVSLKIH